MKPIFLISVAILCCSILSGCRNKSPKDYSMIRGNLPVHYAVKEENYSWDFVRKINRHLVPLQRADYSEGRLISLQSDRDTLIGLNYKESQLVFFDSSLHTLGSFGRSGAGSVASNNGILSFGYQDNHFYLYDFGSKSVKKYNVSGNSLLYRHSIINPTGIYRVGHLMEDRYIYTRPDDSSRDMEFILFDSLSTNVKATWSLNRLAGIAKKEDYPGMAYDGNFISANNSKYMIYYCSFTGLFFCWDKEEGSFRFLARTIDRTPAPKAAYKPISMDHKSLEITPSILFFPSASLDKDTFYLLNSISDSADYVLDSYRLTEEGSSYAGSFFIPRDQDNKRPLSITVENKILYALYEDQSIIKYAIGQF